MTAQGELSELYGTSELENQPVFADLIASVLEVLCGFKEGTLLTHTQNHTRFSRVGWSYTPHRQSEVTS